MHREGIEVYHGVLAEYDLDHNFATVIISASLDVHVGRFKHGVEILPCGKVLALGRGISGKLISTSVILSSDLSGSEDIEDLPWKMSEVNLSYDTNILFCFCYRMH